MNNVVKNSKTSPKKSVTAKQQAKSNLTKRKNPDWDNLDRGYRYLTQDMKLPHDQAVAVMGNVVEESQGDYKAAQKNGGGRGLIQWDGRKVPSGRYSQWGSIWASVAKPANVYDSTTDTVKNYWAPWGGLKGDKVRQKFIKAPIKEKARIYAESYLRPGKPRIADRQLSAMQLDSIYNPRIKDVIVQKDGGMLEFLKNGGQVRKMQTASGGPISINNKGSDRDNYQQWLKLSPTQKLKRRINIAKTQFNQSSSPIYNSLKAIFGGYDPENPDLITGEPSVLPSRGVNPKTVQNVTKGVRTLEDYLKTTKVTAQALEGSSAARSAYATDRYLGGVMFENNLPEAASQIQGHGMAKASTLQENLARLRYILDNGLEKGKTFFTAPLKVSDARIGSALGTGGGKPYFDGHFLITGKPGQMINSVDDIGTIYINDAYENEEALKAAQKLQKYLQQTYPKINFKLYSQGFKQGGKMNVLEFLKNGSGIHIKEKNKGKFTSYCGGKVTNECIQKGKNSSNPAIRKRATFADNARHFKHKKGGELIKKAQLGTQLPKAEDAAQRYKNGEFIKEFQDNNEGHAIIQGVMTNKPFHNQGSIVRKINYRMGIPVDTTYIETPPSLLPVKKTARVATRYSDWKNNMYAGNQKDLYNTLKNRWEKANQVMRRKNGGILKAQYGAPLNISSEDVQRGLKFLNNGLNKVLGVLNTPVAGSAPTVAYLPNGQQIEIPGTQGGAPDILPGKIGGAKKLQSVAKIKDKGLTVTKQLDSAVRHDMVNIDQDLRHYGFKTKRISPEELIDKMKKYREFRGYSDHLTKRLNNLKRDNKQSMKDFKTLKNKYEDMFNDFLHNGVKKGQLGMALTQFDDSENPNAVGGDIVNSYIRNQLMIPYLNKQKEDYEKWKLQMQQQANTQKSSLFDNLLNAGLSIGTDYLKSKLGIGTEKADS